jgi:hypothetical protein
MHFFNRFEINTSTHNAHAHREVEIDRESPWHCDPNLAQLTSHVSLRVLGLFSATNTTSAAHTNLTASASHSMLAMRAMTELVERAGQNVQAHSVHTSTLDPRPIACALTSFAVWPNTNKHRVRFVCISLMTMHSADTIRRRHDNALRRRHVSRIFRKHINRCSWNFSRIPVFWEYFRNTA